MRDPELPCPDCLDPRACAEDVCPELLLSDEEFAPTDVEAWFEIDH